MSIRSMFPNSYNNRDAIRVPVSLLPRDLTRLLDDIFPSFTGNEEGRSSAFSPSLDVHENDKEYIVHAELPGVDEKDIDLSLKDNHLILRGEKRNQVEKSEQGKRYVERTYGSFQRVVPFAMDVDEEAIDASFAKGVLTVKLPKSKATKSDQRKITVKTQ